MAKPSTIRIATSNNRRIIGFGVLKSNKFKIYIYGLAFLIFLVRSACGAVPAVRPHAASAVAVHTLSDDIYQGEYEHCQKRY